MPTRQVRPALLRIVPVLCAALLCLSATWAFSKEKARPKVQPKAQAAPYFDPKASEILGKSCQALASMRAFSVEAEVLTDKVYRDGSKVQFARTMTLRAQRPDKFTAVTAGDDLESTSVYDGRSFTLFFPKKNAYATVDAPGDIDSTLQFLNTVHHLESPLGDLLRNNPCAVFKAVSGYYLGKGLVGKTLCDHLFFKSKDFDWQLWVEDGGASLPRKLVITEKRLPMAPQFTAFPNNWKAGDSAPIRFEAPAGATRADSFATLLTGKK